MQQGRVVWTSDTLTHGLVWFKNNVDDEILEIVEDFAGECEVYMKDNAPWQDRTTDARNGLTGRAYSRGSVHGVELAHGVYYGRFLEFKFGGRDAIVIPTLEVKGPELMRRLNGLYERVDYQGV